MRAELIFVSGAQLGNRVSIDSDECLIGGQPDCDVFFSPERYPHVHDTRVLLRHQAKGWQVSTLEGGQALVNQTYLTSPVSLRSGDVIRISEWGPDMRFEVSSDPMLPVPSGDHLPQEGAKVRSAMSPPRERSVPPSAPADERHVRGIESRSESEPSARNSAARGRQRARAVLEKLWSPKRRKWSALAAAAAVVALLVIGWMQLRPADGANPLVVLAVENPESGSPPALIPVALGCVVDHQGNQFVLTTATVASLMANSSGLKFVVLPLAGAADRTVAVRSVDTSQILVHKIYPIALAIEDPNEAEFAAQFFDLALVRVEGEVPCVCHAALGADVVAIEAGDELQCWYLPEAAEAFEVTQSGVRIPEAWSRSRSVRGRIRQKTPLWPEPGARELLELDLPAAACGAGSVLLNRARELVAVRTTPTESDLEPGEAERFAKAAPIYSEMIASLTGPTEGSYWVPWDRDGGSLAENVR